MADKKDKKEDEKEVVEEAPKKKSKKKLILIAAPVLLIIIGAAVFFLFMGKKEAVKTGEETEETAEESGERKLASLKIEPLIVNLSENISFLKVTMIVEYDPAIFAKAEKGSGEHAEAHGGGGSGGEKKEEGPATPPRFAERQPMIRDAIIRVLSSKKVSDVINTEGKEKLKEELIEAINEAIGLPENPVVNVYFTDFIVQ